MCCRISLHYRESLQPLPPQPHRNSTNPTPQPPPQRRRVLTSTSADRLRSHRDRLQRRHAGACEHMNSFRRKSACARQRASARSGRAHRDVESGMDAHCNQSAFLTRGPAKASHSRKRMNAWKLCQDIERMKALNSENEELDQKPTAFQLLSQACQSFA